METVKSLKADNAIKVFHAALERSSTSRTAISNDTGLSYVTVDKIVNSLLDKNILKQTHSSKSAVIERRSRMLLPKIHYWIAVYEILPSKFSFYMYDLSLHPFRSFSYSPEDSIFIDDILNGFLRKTLSFAREYADYSCCIGSAVLVPGKYNDSEDKVDKSPIFHLPSIKIKKFFSAYSFNTVPQVYSVYSAFVGYLQSSINRDEAVYSLFLNTDSIYASYVIPDQQYIHISDISALPKSCNRSFTKLCKAVPEPELLFNDLCDIIYLLMNTLKITKITLCDRLYSNPHAVCTVMKNILTSKCNNIDFDIPDIVHMDSSSYGQNFISREIRDRWFLEKILTDKA